jgi:hypothetical protein
VTIVAAGVHNAVMDRSELKAGFFLDGKRIRVSPQYHTGDSGLSRDIRDDAGTSYIGAALKVEAPKKFANHTSCARFLPT